MTIFLCRQCWLLVLLNRRSSASLIWSHSHSAAIEILIKGRHPPNIKGQTSLSWLGKGKGLSLCVCACICLLHSKLRKKRCFIKFLLYRTKQTCLAVRMLFFFLLLATMCVIYAFTYEKTVLRIVWLGCLLCLTYGCMVARNVSALTKCGCMRSSYMGVLFSLNFRHFWKYFPHRLSA